LQNGVESDSKLITYFPPPQTKEPLYTLQLNANPMEMSLTAATLHKKVLELEKELEQQESEERRRREEKLLQREQERLKKEEEERTQKENFLKRANSLLSNTYKRVSPVVNTEVSHREDIKRQLELERLHKIEKEEQELELKKTKRTRRN